MDKRKRKVELLTAEEARALIGHAYRARGLAGVRDTALIVLLYRGGLRLAEALALLPRDVACTTGDVTVHRGKGARRRVVRLDGGALELVRRWIDRRRDQGMPAGSPLICTISRGQLRPGREMSQQAVRAMLCRRAKAVGIKKRVNPHLLRHCYASELHAEGKTLATITAMLGHSSPLTTMIYLHELHPEQHLAAAADRPPLEI